MKYESVTNWKQRNEALRLRLEGWTYQMIGDKLGISRQRAQQITSPRPHIRRIIVEKARGECESCGIYVGKSGHVHHKDGNGDDYNDIENLQLLCLACHRVKHGGSMEVEERLMNGTD